jgi:hypothetical protein
MSDVIIHTKLRICIFPRGVSARPVVIHLVSKVGMLPV